MIELADYTKEHKLELERLLCSTAWQGAIKSGLVEKVKAERIAPGNTRNFIDTVVNQLIEFNKERVGELIAQGCENRDYLLKELSKWPENLEGKNPKISFLGLNITAGCNLAPKCTYCNQPYIKSSVDLDGWKSIVEEVTANNNGGQPYIYITGGEPLILGKNIWGDNGLVRFATQKGAGVNINTNAAMLTPEIALRLIKAGLGKLHISLDTSNKDLQNHLRGRGSFEKTLEGIYNIQLARDIIGVSYPVVHTNCVLTNKNLNSFPQLFNFILEKHKQTADKKDSFYNDLFSHMIPVGGNDYLRPSEDEFKRFYEKIWSEVCKIWDSYLESFGVPKSERKDLSGHFLNPFLRVNHKGGLDAYVKVSAEGSYGKLALSQNCYVAPTQASFTPDGNQYRCGSHAVRRILPVGNIRERGVFDSIRAGISDVELPQEEYCHGCALATLHINQSVESKLKEKLESMISV